MQRYMDCMDEIKNRWAFIRKAIQETYSKVEIEQICLNFKRIVESIFLANLPSREDHYLQPLHDLAGMWNVHDIMKTISHVNPNYYPIAIKTEEAKFQGIRKPKDTYISKMQG